MIAAAPQPNARCVAVLGAVPTSLFLRLVFSYPHERL